MAKSTLHPLDPLSPDEIRATAAAVRTAVAEKRLENLRFNTITLKVWLKQGFFCWKKMGILMGRAPVCDVEVVPKRPQKACVYESGAMDSCHRNLGG